MKDQQLLKILKSLANERRLKIIKLLMKNDQMTVSAIASNINLSFRSTSKHLFRLYQASIVNYNKIGLKVLYSLNKPFGKKIINLFNKL